MLSRSVRAARRSPVLLALLAAAACSGGGGGAAPPDLAIGVDLTGAWSVTATVSAASGSCTPLSVDPRLGIRFGHDRSAGRLTMTIGAQDVVGTIRGTKGTIQGDVADGSDVLHLRASFDFAVDGESLQGSILVLRDPDCSTTLLLQGTRALRILASSPSNGSADADYDTAINVRFDRALDNATAIAQNVRVRSDSTSVPFDVTSVGDSIQIVPRELLPVGAEIQVTLSRDIAAADGRTLAVPTDIRFTTALGSTDFTFQFLAPSELLALDLLPPGPNGGFTTLTAPDVNQSGQRWRLVDLRPIGIAAWSLATDATLASATLEGADGIEPARMNPVTNLYASPFGGTLWVGAPGSVGMQLRIDGRIPVAALVRDLEIGGSFARLGNELEPFADWRMRAVSRIATAFPTIAVDPGNRVQAQISATDPAGLRNNAFANLYSLTLTEATPLRLTMRSSDPAIDCFLFVLGDGARGIADLSEWSKAVLAFDDDGGANDPGALSIRDSHIEITLPAGKYFVAATTFDSNRVGAYELQVDRIVQPLVGNGAPAIAPPPLPAPSAGADFRSMRKAR